MHAPALVLRCWLVALLAACGGCASTTAPPSLALRTMGGEAWTFRKQIDGRVELGRCDAVVLRTQHDAVEATLAEKQFHATVPLRQGDNEVRAECRGRDRVLAASEAQRWKLQLEDAPKAWVRVRATPTSILLDAGRSQLAAGAPAPLARFAWSQRAGNPAALTLKTGAPLDGAAGEHVEIAAPAKDGEYYVRVSVTDALGRSDEGAAVFRVEDGVPTELYPPNERAAWIDAAVVYGAAPFFFGADGFAGLRERLDEIAALGATAVWLSPITVAARDDFGYAVVDHFRLRDTFGDEREFRRLIARAHELGLKVIIDFVPNHFSGEHRYYADALRHGARSAYFDWFDRDAAGEVTHYFDWKHLQNLEFDHPEVQNHMIEAFAHWVRTYDVDGFRVDATWAIRERAPEFWPRWREELKRIKPDLLLLAEASVRDPYYGANGFDAAYDWSMNIGEWAWRDVFDESRTDVARLRAALTHASGSSGDEPLTFRFLNNNDTGERFIARNGPELTKLAATLMFMLPGMPLIYNGDEVGAQFEPYDEGPPIEWRDPHGLTPHYARLAELRRGEPALRGRTYELLSTSEDEAVLAFRRPGASADEDLIVLINFSEQDRGVRTNLRCPKRCVDILSDEVIVIDERRPVVRLKGRGARALRGANVIR